MYFLLLKCFPSLDRKMKVTLLFRETTFDKHRKEIETQLRCC